MMAGAKLILLGLCLILGGFTVSAGVSVKDTQILILGAGPAGLRAADKLLENGITDFIILDGNDRIGGLTERLADIGGVTVNTGEIFIWNEEVEGLRAQGLSLQQITWGTEVRNDRNEDITDDYNTRWEEMDAARTAVNEDISPAILARQRPDISAKTAMAMKGWLATTPLDKVTQWFDFQYDVAVAIEDMSVLGPYQQDLLTEVEVDWYFVTDYANGPNAELKERLTDEQVQLNTFVIKVDQSAGGEKVVVTALDSDDVSHEYHADYVISTLSIGVLQHDRVEFTPPLPEWKLEQICRFQSSVIENIYLKFASKFWGDSEWILHASDEDLAGNGLFWPAFLNLDREGFHPGSGILVASLSKEEAVRVDGLTDEKIMEEIVQVLGLMYGEENVSELEEIKYSLLINNPNFYGDFSTYPVPANIPQDLHQRMGARVDRVFFADETASAVNIGRQIGNEEEAERAVDEIMECIAGECAAEYEPTPYWGMPQCEKEDGGELYGCVKILKKEGKTRKAHHHDHETPVSD